MIWIWWAARDRRERRLLLGGGLCLLAAFWYVLVYEPLIVGEQRAAHRLQASRSAYQEIRHIHDQAMALHLVADTKPRSASGDAGQRLSLAVRLAQAQGLKDAIRRMTPQDDGSFSLWLTPQSFKVLAPWLLALRHQGIRIVSMNYDPTTRSAQEIRLR